MQSRVYNTDTGIQPIQQAAVQIHLVRLYFVGGQVISFGTMSSNVSAVVEEEEKKRTQVENEVRSRDAMRLLSLQ
jgi:hypothetical protein